MLRVFARCCRKLQQCHFKWQAAAHVGRAAATAVKVRLISPPIKLSLCMEQLSTAILQGDTSNYSFSPSKSLSKTLYPSSQMCFVLALKTNSTEETLHVFSPNADTKCVSLQCNGRT